MEKKHTYKEIISYIINKINHGEFAENQQLPTEKAISGLFDTSRTTVVKALDELESMGYIERIQGKGSFVRAKSEKKKPEQKLISLIIPFANADSNNASEMEIIRGCECYLKEVGYSLMIHCIDFNTEEEYSVIQKCKEGLSSGIILYTPVVQLNLPLLFDLILSDYPIICIDKNLDSLPISCVQSDNLKGGFEATKYLLQRGYSDIYFISDTQIDYVSSARDRYYGYCKALKENGKILSDKLFINGYAMANSHYSPFNYDEKPQVFREILSRIVHESEGRPGIFAVNDSIGVLFEKAALDMNVKIPEELGIIGYDDTNFAKMGPVPLTTIKQNFFDIGKNAALAIINKIAGKSVERNIYIDIQLIARDSTI